MEKAVAVLEMGVQAEVAVDQKWLTTEPGVQYLEELLDDSWLGQV